MLKLMLVLVLVLVLMLVLVLVLVLMLVLVLQCVLHAHTIACKTFFSAGCRGWARMPIAYWGAVYGALPR